MKACANKAWGNDSLEGKKVLVQGAGSVGQYLVGHLLEAGAVVSICDINEDRIKQTLAKHAKVTVVAAAEMLDQDMDIYAPCALGATLNTDSIAKLKCAIVAGAANNQLDVEAVHGKQLIDKGIIYAPDFLLNAGGLINVSAEIGIYNKAIVLADVEKIYGRLQDCLRLAENHSITAQEAAMQMAKKRIADMKELKSRR
jgi:leucine dehydrogenase